MCVGREVRKLKGGAGELTHLLRALAALVEDSGLMFSTHIGSSQQPVTPIP